SGDGRLLCLSTKRTGLEIWDLHRDESLRREELAIADLVAADDACLVFGNGTAHLVPIAGAPRALASAATAIAYQEGSILVATTDRILVLDTAGRQKQHYLVDKGATAIGQVGEYLAVGYDAGDLELLPLAATATKPSFGFESVPATPVVRIVGGPTGTLIAGFSDGTLGMWELRNGARLDQWKLHGPVVYLQTAGSMLIAATALGDYLVLDLATFTDDYCHVLREIWSSIPVVWENGLPVVRAPPTRHSCRRASASRQEVGH
ncbi:MAG: hypothetical protein V2A73_09955, partial [Pseudomonadota bacterium]